jgi:hypothetical protein
MTVLSNRACCIFQDHAEELRSRLEEGSLAGEDVTRLQDLSDELDTVQAEIELNEVGNI